MKLTTLTIAALSTLTTAQSYYDTPSAAFSLVVRSSNSTLNGTTLGPCHQGAAIAGLCPTGSKLPDPSPPFYHNVSSASNQKPGAANADGILSYILHASGIDVPSAMSMDAGLSSNVVNPTFYPNVEPYTLLAFDENGCAYISAGQDDTVSPPTYYDPSRKLNNWYICLTRWSYLYYTLSWKIGVTGEPQNPSCQKVDVMRIFN